MQAGKKNNTEASKSADPPAHRKTTAQTAQPELAANPLWQGLATHVAAKSSAGGAVPEVQRLCDDCEAESELGLGSVQAKLSLGGVDDPHERQADAVAERVVSAPAVGLGSSSQLNPVWQSLATHAPYQSALGTSGEVSPVQASDTASTIQRRCLSCEDESGADVPQLQTKLTMGGPDDEYERQADAIAEKVTRMPTGGVGQIPFQKESSSIRAKPLNGGLIQRLCAECEEELGENDTPSIQTKSNSTASQVSVPPSIKNTISAPEGGSGLNVQVRSRVEPVLGADLSNVRVHSNVSAQEASSHLNAKAFTHRNHIFLGRGQSSTDLSLMAHEATHTLQQAAGSTDQEYMPTVMRIPETAGEMRLGRELMLDESDLRYMLEDYLNNGDFAGIDTEYGEALPAGLRFVDILEHDMPPTLDSLNALEGEVHSQLIGTYYDNILALVLESFSARDTSDLSGECPQVSGTYRNLAFLYQWEVDYPNYVPPEGAASDWFHNRTLIFLEFARDSEEADFAATLAAMAAEIERTAWEDVEGPVNTASVTVESLFVNGISLASLDSLSSLYDRVLGTIEYDPQSDEGQAMETYRALWVGDMGDDVLLIEEQLQDEARDSDDDTRLNEFHTELAAAIGHYLALVDNVELADRTDTHIRRVEALLQRYGNPQSVPQFLLMFVDIAWPERVEEEYEEEAQEAPEPEVEAPPIREPAEPVEEDAGEEEAGCQAEVYDARNMDEWIRFYWEDGARFWSYRLNGPGLLCGMGLGTDITGEEAERRVESMRSIVASSLSRLNTLMRRATSKAQIVYELRQSIFPTDPEAQFSAESSEGGQAEAERPDFVDYFQLPYEAYGLLSDALNYHLFDPTTYTQVVIRSYHEYFEPLNFHLDSLRRALELTQRMRESGAATLLTQEFPDDYGPAVTRLLQTAESCDAWTTDYAVLERAQGLDYSVSRLSGMSERAETTMRVRDEQALQEAISTALPEAALEFWHNREIEGREHRDTLYPSDVTPGILDRITVPEGMDHLAETYIQLAVTNFNAGTLQRLALEANSAAQAGDSQRISEIIASITELQRVLGTEVMDEGLGELSAYARGQTEFLLFLYVTAQTQLSLAHGDGRLPGQVARTGRMLSLSMQHLHTLTLTDTLDRLQGISGTLEALMAVQESSAEWSEGTDLFPFIDALQIQFRDYSVMDDLNAVESDKTDAGNALYWLLAAEQSGGGEARGEALAGLAQVLRDADTVGCYSAARLMYTTALGIDVAQQMHEMLKPPEVVEAETLLNRAGVQSPGDNDPLERPPITDEELDAYEKVERYRDNRSEVVNNLDSGIHPVRGTALTDNERSWWAEHNDVSGHGQLLPGEEGWQEAQDFGKELVFMAALTYVTGGLGSGASTALGGGRLATLGVAGLEIGAITGATRFRQTMISGVRPHTPFWEDFILNAATMGAERLSHAAYNSLFRVNPATTGLRRHIAGRMVSEYLATSVVTRAHLSISSAMHGTALSDDQIRQSYLTNAGFLVAMKGRDLLGSPASGHIRGELEALASDTATVRLLERLRQQDSVIDEAALEVANAETQMDRDAALARMEDAFRAKTELIESSGIRDLSETAVDFGDAVTLFQRDVAQARVFGAVNMEPVPGTRDMTYSQGGASEAALTRHLNESGADFQVLEGAHGAIFEVRGGDGGLTRILPREAQLVGATSGRSFLAVGRGAGEGVLHSGDHAALAEIIRQDTQIDQGIRDQLVAGHQFHLDVPDAMVSVELRLVENYSANLQGHDPGPAQYRIEAGEGQFRVVIEVLNRATNDQIGRAVSHEVREIQRVVETIVDNTGGGAEMYQSRTAIDSALLEQRGTGVLQEGSRATEPTADDLGRLEELRYFHGKMREIHEALDARPSPAEATRLRERLHLMEAEYRRAWRETGLSASQEVLAQQLQIFADAGQTLDRQTRTAIEEARFAAEHGWESRQGLRMIDLQIIMSELQKANPNLVAGTSIFDIGAYYQERIAARAEAVYADEMADHGDPDLALARAVESAREMLGGTGIASWRGRAFEGLSAEELNNDPAFLQQYGYLHTVSQNNYPTYDAVSVQGATSRLRIDESPLVIPSPTGGPPTRRTQLQIFDAAGNRIFHWMAGRPPTVTTAAGYRVFLWSDKARGSYEIYQMYRAAGSARTTHDSGHLLSTPEFADRLQRSIDWARTRVQNLSADPTASPAELARMQTRLTDLLHFQSRLEVSRGWSNARLDALLQSLRDSSVNVDEILSGVYEQYPASGSGP